MAARIHQLSIDTAQTQAKFISRPTSASPPHKKEKMTLSQTYVLAHTARNKLSKEAARADHDLRLLVGHANLLDSLMLELADAEREQEQWFNQTVRGASKAAAVESRHIKWAETIAEQTEWEEEDSDSDSDSDFDESEIEMASAIAPREIQTTTVAVDEDEYEDDDEESHHLALTRTYSHTTPELLQQDSDEESSEDEQPPSPPAQALEYSEKERQAMATTSFYQSSNPTQTLLSTEQETIFDEEYYLPRRNAPAMVAVC